MEFSTIKHQHRLSCPQLPLAVYREIMAHLRQVEGVDAALITRSIEHNPQEEFDYYQSQVAALQIYFTKDLTESTNRKVKAILHYYAQRYHPWEVE